MAHHIPLQFLRTFEAAARHQSFTKAAKELNVTAAAVSQQMRGLEERLGLPLFTRGARSLVLTRAGNEYASAISAGLAIVAEATFNVRRPIGSGKLKIGTFTSLAYHWLLPRLEHFRKRFPDIQPELVIDSRLADFGPKGIDVAVRFGSGNYQGLCAEHLMDEYVFPACSPSLLNGRAPPKRTAQLSSFPLLHDAGLVAGERRMAWADWLGKSYDAVPERQLIFLPDGLFALQSALLGQGIAIVRSTLAADYLKAGRLIRLGDEQRKADFSYWLVTAEGDADARITAFKGWMKAESAALRDSAEPHA